VVAAIWASAVLVSTSGPEASLTVVSELDRLAEAAGLGLIQVSASGHRFTSDRDIFDALDLANAKSLLRFDGRAARARLERLPWVRTATVTRILPDQVAVVVTERQPLAVWQRPGRDLLIDSTGRVLAAATETDRRLPRVAGEGAGSEFATFLQRLSHYPEIASRLEVAERIGERRWTLRLTRELTIQLPAHEPERALADLVRPETASRFLTLEAAAIDLRSPRWTLLRRHPHRDAGMGAPA
jgi:cell division protein FtsQ